MVLLLCVHTTDLSSTQTASMHYGWLYRGKYYTCVYDWLLGQLLIFLHFSLIKYHIQIHTHISHNSFIVFCLANGSNTTIWIYASTSLYMIFPSHALTSAITVVLYPPHSSFFYRLFYYNPNKAIPTYMCPKQLAFLSLIVLIIYFPSYFFNSTPISYSNLSISVLHSLPSTSFEKFYDNFPSCGPCFPSIQCHTTHSFSIILCLEKH